MTRRHLLLSAVLGVVGGVAIALLTAAILPKLAGQSPADSRGNAAANEALLTASPPILPVLWTVPAFSFVDQDGQPVVDRDLLGRPWVADFIFTRCTTACPILTARMRLVQRRLTDPRLRFVSFSVDPAYDTPAVLKQYATLWHGDAARWRLLNTGDDLRLHALAAGMKVTVEKADDPASPIVHTDRLMLIDATNHVRGLYDSNDSAAVEQLITDAKKLLPPDATQPTAIAPPPGNADTGKALYDAVGCMACHTQPRIAPPLQGVAGSTVMLEGGGTTTADAAYLRESLVDPNAKVVAGYVPRMPSYRGQLSDEQIESLVAYLQRLPAADQIPAPTTAAAIVIDPVCHMHVRASDDEPHVTIAGKTYYFCSDTCKEHFTAAPIRYLAATQPATMP